MRQAPHGRAGVRALERGDIFFFYHPKAGGREVHGLEDVGSFHLVLHPQRSSRYRYAAIELKGLLAGYAGKGWRAKLESAENRLDPILHRLKAGHPLPAARPCGEGIYAIIRHGDHTHLAYALELPAAPGAVQKALGLAHAACPFVSVRNPLEMAEAQSSPEIELPEYPPELLRLFGDRPFEPADPAALLDYAGAELLISGMEGARPEDFGLRLEPEREIAENDEAFRMLDWRGGGTPLAPLFAGSWA